MLSLKDANLSNYVALLEILIKEDDTESLLPHLLSSETRKALVTKLIQAKEEDKKVIVDLVATANQKWSGKFDEIIKEFTDKGVSVESPKSLINQQFISKALLAYKQGR